MADKKHDKATQQLLDEVFDVANDLPEGSAKRALLEGLYNNIDQAESYNDAVNIAWANKDLPLRMFTTDELSLMPNVAKTFVGEPRTGKVDKEKEFGEDWYKNFENIPYSQIAMTAAKNGVEPKQLINEMAAEATAKRRHDIAYGEDEGGWLESPLRNLGGAALHMFRPRAQEAIARGEEPSIKDNALDAAQNALYAIPYGQTARLFANPTAKTIIGGVLANAGAPFATEALDDIAYDDVNNARSNFNWKDAVAGTGVNLVGGALLRGAGAGINRMAPGFSKELNELALGKTSKEVVDEIRQQYKFNVNVANDPTVPQAARQKAQEMVKLMESDPELYAAISTKDPVVFNVAEQEGATLADKANAYIKENKLDANTVLTPEGSEIFVPVKDKFINRTSEYSPVSASLTKAYDKLGLGTSTEQLKTKAQLAREEAAKNYFTNEFAGYRDEQGQALTRIPLIGPALQKALEEDAKKKAEHEENMRILDELRARGLIYSER